MSLAYGLFIDLRKGGKLGKKSIWVHTLVKNEERYLWYAVVSVVDFVDKILLWDTGSSDRTVEIIKEIQKVFGKKIEFREMGSVSPEEFTKVRQQMLDQSKCDWILLVDGDEVWWENSIKSVIKTIEKEKDLDMIVSPYYNVVGDIYHYQEERAGKYRIDDKSGHINIRAINRKIPGLHLEKPHGQQGFYDGNGTLIQERTKRCRKFVDAPYMHFTNMARSCSKENDSKVPKRYLKFKYEIGLPFPENFKYPEVFYRDAPIVVLTPWIKMSGTYFLRALLETQLKKLKRKFWPTSEVGY